MWKLQVGLSSTIILGIAVLLLQPCFAQTSSQGTTSESKDITVQLNGGIFPMHKIAECDLDGLIYQSGDFSINNYRSHLSIQGRDLSGNAWEAQTSITGLGCEIFQADLEGNEKQDLIIRAPGIGSTTPYDTRLTILLFDAAGKPVPWSATGNFNATNNGIKEISRSQGGGAVIMHNYMAGHPSWGGVTYVSKPYQVVNSEITSITGTYSGVMFPKIIGARAADPTFQRAVNRMSLSTADGSQKTALESQTGQPRFVRYGSDAPTVIKSQNNAPITAEQGARLTIDMDALNAAAERILLSDGSKLGLPAILIVDSSSGRRKIVFAPEGSDLTQLEKKSYSIQQIGADCPDADECQPFILRAVEQNPQQ